MIRLSYPALRTQHQPVTIFGYVSIFIGWEIPMRRERMVETLVIDSMVRILDQHRILWLSEILEAGFKGFAHMSDEELCSEIVCRGLTSDARTDTTTLDGEEDWPIDDDPELRNLIETGHDHANRNERAFEAN
jgi:hypothetical protein